MKRFNNLYDSICVLVYCVLAWIISIIIITNVVIPLTTKSQYIGALILFVIFTSTVVVTFLAFIEHYFDWWRIDNNKIEYKKLFRKRIIIHTADITKIVKSAETRVGIRKIPIFYKIASYDAYAVYTKKSKAVILSSEKTRVFLDSYFEQFNDKLEDKTEKSEKVIG